MLLSVWKKHVLVVNYAWTKSLNCFMILVIHFWLCCLWIGTGPRKQFHLGTKEFRNNILEHTCTADNVSRYNLRAAVAVDMT